jgi:aspartyl/asparaginyl beta-hydroxylase (cupin superfamily)
MMVGRSPSWWTRALVVYVLLNVADNVSSMRLADRIMNAVNQKFKDRTAVARVIDCFDRFNAGEELDIMLGDGQSDHNRQKANCFVKGLTTATFHDINNGKFEWTKRLEENAQIIQDELKQFLNRDASGAEAESSTSRWLGPRFVQENFGHYGPEWKTLGLQDRGVWDGDNVDSFPKTVALLGECNVPCQEAFFARQGPSSGIQPHSDLNNFILTAHLAVDVPEGECWIRVGDDKHYWKNGKMCAFDTSIFHSTFNEAATDRFVLLIRFWHPDLTETEVKAFTFIFDYLDHVNMGDAAVDAFEAEHVYGLTTSTSASSNRQDIAATADAVAESLLAGAESMSRQQRREQERKLAKATAKKTKGGFHRGG